MRGDRLGAGGLHVDRDVNYLHHSTHVAVVVEDLLASVEARVTHADDLRAYLSLLRVRHDRAHEIGGDPAYEDGRHIVAAGDELVLGELHARLLRDLNVGVVIQVAVAVKIAPAHGNRRCMDWSFGHSLVLLSTPENTSSFSLGAYLDARKPKREDHSKSNHFDTTKCGASFIVSKTN